MQKGEQAFGEQLGAFFLANGVAKRHLFEGKKQAPPRLNAHGTRRYVQITAIMQRLSKRTYIEMLVPLLMCQPLVIPFPGQVGLIAKTTWKNAVEFVHSPGERRGRF
jgi:hypothetical protein